MKEGAVRPLLFAVAGRPILHSQSPALQAAAFQAEGIDALYFRMTASCAGAALRAAREMGLSGLNVTAPFKEDCARQVDELSTEAARVGAANTLLLGERTRGLNTDAEGVARALKSSGIPVRGARAVVLGAGGAARAAAWALRLNGAHVSIVNRTLERANQLARELGGEPFLLDRAGLARALNRASILVACTGSSERLVPPELLTPALAVLDARYSSRTALEKDARAAGCTVVDGLQWLLFQGALAFELFTGRAAPISAMERALRSHRRSPMPTRPGSNGRRHLALIGFMGSGKSCVGRIIAERRGSRFIDIDERVAARSGQSVASIFQTRGEAEFRRLESEEIARAAAEPGAVISCGGGALLDRRNAASLWETSCLVWLWAGLNTTLDRLQNDSSRPLLPGGDRQGRARALLEERIPLYASSADFAVVTESLSPDGVAELILDETDRAEQN